MPSTTSLNGIEITGDTPNVAGNFPGRCLVIGSSAGLWDDVRALYRKDSERRYDYCGVNFGGYFWPYPLKHFVSLHANYIQYWLPMRLKTFSQGHIHTHAGKKEPLVETAWSFVRPAAMSGLFACKAMLACGYSEIVLLGNPMDDSGHFYDPPVGLLAPGEQASWEVMRYRHRENLLEWEQASIDEFKGRVKSMSGYTRDLLGEPK